MRLLVFGGWGQLGSDLALASTGRHELIRPTHAEVDVRDLAALDEAVHRHRPDVVVNAAAFHRVERCEQEPGPAFEVNAVGALNVGRAARSAGARSVYVSTDYVFPGDHPEGYREDDPVGPVNVYGVSKAAGERLTRLACPESLVVRASGMFGHAGSSGKGGNFVETMLARAASGEPISVVDDQVFSPTATADLAERLLELLRSDAPPGTYHLANRGACSWFEFARAVLELSGSEGRVSPRSTEEAEVRRPRWSVLLDTRTEELGMKPARPWEEALRRYLAGRPGSNSALAPGRRTAG